MGKVSLAVLAGAEEVGAGGLLTHRFRISLAGEAGREAAQNWA